jgi:lipopolysaccharide export system permease protein
VRLDRYLAARFLRAFAATFAVFFALFGLIDLMEQVRRFGDDVEGMGAIVALVLLNAPSELIGIVPLVTLVAAVALFLGLARSSELVIVRGTGRSAIRALLGPALVAVLLGLAAAGAMNPLAAVTAREYDARVARLRGAEDALALSGEGLWLRQGGPEGATVIHADRVVAGGMELLGVMVLRLGPDGRAIERVEAERARLSGAEWVLDGAKVWPLGAANPEAGAEARAELSLPASVSAAELRDGGNDPSQVPLWRLPAQIERLETAGFAAERHRVFLQVQLAQPAFLLAMLLVAACFTLRPQRGRRTGIMVLAAILAGFGATMLRDLALALGEAGQVSPALAVWAPTLAVIGLAAAALLHLEEG